MARRDRRVKVTMEEARKLYQRMENGENELELALEVGCSANLINEIKCARGRFAGLDKPRRKKVAVGSKRR